MWTGLELLASPPPFMDKAAVVELLVNCKDFGVLQDAVEGGLLDPHFKIFIERVEVELVHVAARCGAIPLLRFLIFEKGVSPATREASCGWTPLHMAVIFQQERAALVLIDDVLCPPVNARNADGHSPLMLAAVHGMVDVMRALIRRGAEEAAGDVDKHTALLFAIGDGTEEAAIFLLEEGGAEQEIWGGGRGICWRRRLPVASRA